MFLNLILVSVNRIWMDLVLFLIGKYVSLYLGIVRRNGEVNDSEFLFEWMVESVRILGLNIL